MRRRPGRLCPRRGARRPSRRRGGPRPCPQALDRVRARADPCQSRGDNGAREISVLREEAVPGVHRVRTGSPGDAQDLVDDQVGVRARGAVQRVRLVRQLSVQGIAILVGEDGDGGNAAVCGGTDDADGDLTAVGDEDFTNARHASQPIGGDPPSLGYTQQTFSGIVAEIDRTRRVSGWGQILAERRRLAYTGIFAQKTQRVR